jgi:hypothetical protein
VPTFANIFKLRQATMSKSVEAGVLASPVESTHELSRRPKPRKWWKFGGQDQSFVSVDAETELDSETSSKDGDNLVKNVNNVFEAPEATDIYKPIAKFEGSHRFDASATWEPAEEKRLVRRVGDDQICFFALTDHGDSWTG